MFRFAQGRISVPIWAVGLQTLVYSFIINCQKHSFLWRAGLGDLIDPLAVRFGGSKGSVPIVSSLR